ncbi:MAG: FliM/FliN family flagellar motor switch protein [Paracoccaceae bacterium]
MLDAADLPTEGEAWNGLLRLMGAAQALPSGAQVLVVTTDGPGEVRLWDIGGDLCAGLVAFPFQSVTGADLSVEGLPRLPAALRDGIERAAFAAIRGVLPDGAPELRGPLDAAPRGLEWLDLTLDGGWGAPARLIVGGTRKALTAAARGAAGAPNQGLEAAIPLSFAVSAGRLTLGVAQLRALAPGDVLAHDAAPSLEGRRLRAPLAQAQGGWMTGPFETDATGAPPDGADPAPPAPDTGPDTGPDAPAAADPVAVDDIPVTLTFVLGTRTLTVAELRALSQGAVLPVDARAEPGAVLRVLANGRDFAEGVAIDLDGRPGLRLTRLAGGGDAPARG